jgi:hypothetical protein
MEKHELEQLEAIAYGKEPWFAARDLKAYLKTVEVTEAEKEGTKTRQQEESYHLWLDLVAKELDKEGHTIQNVVAAIQHAEIRPTGKNLKEVMWRPYMIAALGKETGKRLNKDEVDRIYEGLNKFLGDHFHIHVPFPSGEPLINTRLAQVENTKNTEYPEHTPTAFDNPT